MTKEPAVILVYGATEDDRRVIFMREGESYLNYRLRLVDKGETDKTIETLVHSLPETKVAVDPDAPGLLLFSGMDDQVMRQFLGALRDNQVRFELKAMVTETNRTWTLAALLDELKEEHQLMQAWQQLAAVTEKADLLLMEPAVLLDKGGFEADVEATKAYLRRQNMDEITLDNLTEKRKILEAHLTRLGY
ncbi:MAG TPA: DUF3783 domain-containing protein [Fastidiosipila sp.]|nr:DUF3783 domain-containing protein [Fastidiosipila sp.]